MLAQRKTAELNILKKRQKEDEIARRKEAVKKKRAAKNTTTASRLNVNKRFKNKAKTKVTKNNEPQEQVSKIEPKSDPIDIEKVREWIEANVEKLVTLKHLQKDLYEVENKKRTVETEIDEEQRYYSEISIKKEKAIMRKGKLNINTDEGESLQIEKEVEEYDYILKQNQENIESLEDKISYYNKQIIQLEQAIEQENHNEIKGLNLTKINSVQSAQTLLIAFFNVILEVKIQRVELEEKVVEQHMSISQLERQLKVLKDSKRTSEIEFNKALQKREKEYRELEAQILQEVEAGANDQKLSSNSSEGLTALEAKRLERKKNEQHYSVGAYEDSKRKLSKMMSQLERRLVIEEKKNVAMANLVEQSRAEKKQYKQKYNNLRQKMKREEIEQIRMK